MRAPPRPGAGDPAYFALTADALWAIDDGDRASHLADLVDVQPLNDHGAMKKHTILFLAANPGGTTRLALDREAHAIHVELERSSFRDRFQLVTRWAAEPIDLLRELRKLKPSVVHFSGHGSRRRSAEADSGGRSARDVVRELDVDGGELASGLVFQGPFGSLQVVSGAAIAEAFGAVETPVKLVVLSACYTTVQAEALLAHVECVVGTGGSINDDAARSFAIGFYSGLGERESIRAAYMQGRAAISLNGLRDSDHLELKVRAGVDADKIVLAADAQANATVSSTGALRYLVYLSRVKLDMLAEQLPMQGSNLATLENVIHTLRSQGLIGTIDAPREYFEGKLEMHWGPVHFWRPATGDPADKQLQRAVGTMVLFKGTTPTKATVAMIGSARHLVGDTGSEPSWYSAYSNPAFWAKIAAGLFESDEDRPQIDFHIIEERREPPPMAELVFVAKTFTRRDGLLIGSPLFVEFA